MSFLQSYYLLLTLEIHEELMAFDRTYGAVGWSAVYDCILTF